MDEMESVEEDKIKFEFENLSKIIIEIVVVGLLLFACSYTAYKIGDYNGRIYQCNDMGGELTPEGLCFNHTKIKNSFSSFNNDFDFDNGTTIKNINLEK